MNPVGFIFIIAGLLQAVGALSRSKFFQALPHFQRSKRMFGRDTAFILHVVFGLVGVVIGILILVGIIELPVKN